MIDVPGRPGQASETSIAVDTNNSPHIVYTHPDSKGLKYAKSTCASQCPWHSGVIYPWESEELISITGYTGGYHYYPSLALDPKNTPHIVFVDDNDHKVRYLTKKPSQLSWTIEIVDKGDVTFSDTVIGVDYQGVPHILYFKNFEGLSTLMHASKQGGSWNKYAVDTSVSSGSLSFVFDSKGYPHEAHVRGQSDIPIPGNLWYGYKIQHKNLAISSVISSANEPGNVPQNAVDDKPDTRWASNGPNSWITANLGGSKNICTVEIQWYEGASRQYDFVIATSPDGVTFTDKFTGKSSGMTSKPERYSISPTDANYLKVTVKKNNVNNWGSMIELDILGPKAGGSKCNDWGFNRIIDENNGYKGYGAGSSITMNLKDEPYIGYSDFNADQNIRKYNLNIAKKSGNIWSIEVVDSFRETGFVPDVAFDKGNKVPSIVYQEWWADVDPPIYPELQDLKFTEFNTVANNYQKTSIEYNAGLGPNDVSFHGNTDMVVDSSGVAHVSYVSGNTLKYAVIY